MTGIIRSTKIKVPTCEGSVLVLGQSGRPHIVLPSWSSDSTVGQQEINKGVVGEMVREVMGLGRKRKGKRWGVGTGGRWGRPGQALLRRAPKEVRGMFQKGAARAKGWGAGGRQEPMSEALQGPQVSQEASHSQDNPVSRAPPPAHFRDEKTEIRRLVSVHTLCRRPVDGS